MSKKLINLFTVVLLLSCVTGKALGGISYPDPPGGWTYTFNGDQAASAVTAALDGKWDHYDAGTGGSDAWDGSGIGPGDGAPGGVSALLDGTTTFLRMQDCGNPTNHGFADPSNRKIYFAHNITTEGAANDILDTGVTLSFRARIATGSPLDAQYPATAGGSENNTTPGGTAWPAGGNGYVNHDGGKDSFGIRALNDKMICFALSLATDDDQLATLGSGLTMNKRNGNAVTDAVDIWDNDPGTINILSIADLTVWHEFWIIIQADTSGGGTHKVTIYMDGSTTPAVFHVTASNANDGNYGGFGFLSLGVGATPEMGAIDVDFFAYKQGRVHPPGAMTKASDPDPPNGAQNAKPGSLTWNPGVTAVAHDVYLGYDANAVANATTSSTEYREQKGQGDTSYYPGGLLLPGTTHYWRIDEIEEGDTIYKGNVWSFTTPPLKAYNPSPANGSIYVDPNADLSWSPGFKVKATNGHDVYLGTNATAVADANTSSPEFKINRSSSNWDPGTLALNTTYYWRIDERNTDATVTKGDVWSFTIMPYIPITDPDLLCWWTFDESAGSIVVDRSGYNHHGLFGSPAPTQVVGLIGNGLEFKGTADYIEDADGGTYLNGLSALTVCVWVKSDLTNTDRGFVIFDYPNTGDSRDIRYDAAGSGGGGTNVIKYSITSTGGGQENESSSGIQVTDWQHIAITWSSGEVVRLYINGVLNTPSFQDAATTGTITGCTNIVVGKGCKDTGGTSWDGLVDDFRIYNKVLTAHEIKRLTAPPQAWIPNPTDGATNVEKTAIISWIPGKNAAKHDVYLGIAQDDVNNATDPYTLPGNAVCKFQTQY